MYRFLRDIPQIFVIATVFCRRTRTLMVGYGGLLAFTRHKCYNCFNEYLGVMEMIICAAKAPCRVWGDCTEEWLSVILRLCFRIYTTWTEAKKMKRKHELRDFLILWSTQSISQLGSSITAFALTLWLYEQTGSSLGTATLTICSYAPYVIMSIFAGALTDRFDKKKTMLVCDVLAVLCTVTIFILYKTTSPIHWYIWNCKSCCPPNTQRAMSSIPFLLSFIIILSS